MDQTFFSTPKLPASNSCAPSSYYEATKIS